MNSEIENLKAEIAGLKAELESRDAAADEERRAMMFMLADTNRAVEEMEKAQGKLREEIEVTTHLLMISEAAANITDIDRLMKEVELKRCSGTQFDPKVVEGFLKTVSQ